MIAETRRAAREGSSLGYRGRILQGGITEGSHARARDEDEEMRRHSGCGCGCDAGKSAGVCLGAHDGALSG
jgi:hypothetical protein